MPDWTGPLEKITPHLPVRLVGKIIPHLPSRSGPLEKSPLICWAGYGPRTRPGPVQTSSLLPNGVLLENNINKCMLLCYLCGGKTDSFRFFISFVHFRTSIVPIFAFFFFMCNKTMYEFTLISHKLKLK